MSKRVPAEQPDPPSVPTVSLKIDGKPIIFHAELWGLFPPKSDEEQAAFAASLLAPDGAHQRRFSRGVID